ncbi:MAG: membrane protein insertase YidC [Candidatus Krumholzibacteriota bacterium]|nr:membrane protein insertase YidC [Candidatus Krumholzibacteriota bacterium]
MDRQTRIAFGLIFLLLIGYFIVMDRMRPERPAPVPTTGADSALVAAGAFDEAVEPVVPATEAAAPTTPAEPAGGQAPVMAAAPHRELVVRTNRARYVLDSRGAAMTSIALLEFAGVGSEHVELIGPLADEERAAVLAVDVELPSGTEDSGGWDFALDLPAGIDSVVLAPGEERTILFRSSDGRGGELRKAFTFYGDRYEFLLSVGGEFAGGLGGARGVGIEWTRGIRSTERNLKDDYNSFKNVFLVGDSEQKRSLRNFKGARGLAERGERSEEGTVQWVGTHSKYFMAALVPVNVQSGVATLVGDSEDKYLGFRVDYPLRGGRVRYDEDFHVYAGPLLFNDLKAYGRGLEHMVDMGRLIRPISLAIKWLMDFLGRFIPNYGLIIILLSVLTKFLFYRLTHKSFKSMKDMQRIQPEIKALQEKYKNNKEQLQKATMELYKKHGVNPLGGCLPLLLQMPVFFALYRVLRGAVELRGAGFVWWIDDLSTMDVAYRLPFTIPILGGFIDNAISVLPILMGVSMWIQQKMGGTGMGNGGMGQPGQMAAMNKIMPIFMTFIFYRMPSGLVLYWLVNNILTAAQQYFIHKGLDESPGVVTAKAKA